MVVCNTSYLRSIIEGTHGMREKESERQSGRERERENNRSEIKRIAKET